MNLSYEEIVRTVYQQVTALDGLAEKAGKPLRHVKPHGALYNQAAVDERTAAAIADGVRKVGRPLLLVGLAGSRMLTVWQQEGFRVVGEAFADRRYEDDGTLRPRHYGDALITDPREAGEQALHIAHRGKIVSVTGKEIQVEAQTLCIHSDTPNAQSIAQSVRNVLRDAGIHVGASPQKSTTNYANELFTC